MTIGQQTNVFGEPIEPCSFDPITGYYRTGCCETGGDDTGIHTVCAVMTAEFLEYSKSVGNDLSTPMPQYGFRVSSLVTNGASVRNGGKKPLKLAKRQKLNCAQPTL